MMKALKYLIAYLSDWRNWVSHSIIGILILLIAFYMPVKPFYRIAFLILVVGFNIIRMRMKKKKEITQESTPSK